jgi:hypothetical protein
MVAASNRPPYVIRPLTPSERRWLTRKSIRQTRFFLRIVPLIQLVVGLILFGGLWLLSILATRADHHGPSWRVSGFIWLLIGIPITLWSSRDLRRHVSSLGNRFDEALQQDKVVAIRIQSDAVVALAKDQHKNGSYAFQLQSHRIVVIVGRAFRCSARFPNGDFSILAIGGKHGKVVTGSVRMHGNKLKPVRTFIPRATPEHLTIIGGDIAEIEHLLS